MIRRRLFSLLSLRECEASLATLPAIRPQSTKHPGRGHHGNRKAVFACLRDSDTKATWRICIMTTWPVSRLNPQSIMELAENGAVSRTPGGNGSLYGSGNRCPERTLKRSRRGFPCGLGRGSGRRGPSPGDCRDPRRSPFGSPCGSALRSRVHSLSRFGRRLPIRFRSRSASRLPIRAASRRRNSLVRGRPLQPDSAAQIHPDRLLRAPGPRESPVSSHPATDVTY